MKLCDYCGFVIKDNDVKCFNCRMVIPGREVSESVVKAADVQKNVQLAHSTRSLSSYVPKKLLSHFGGRFVCLSSNSNVVRRWNRLLG